MKRPNFWLIVFATPLSWLAGCGGDAAKSPSTPPSKAEIVAHEADLLRLTLTPEAQTRLGIRTVITRDGTASRTRQTSGEIIVPSFGAAGIPTGSARNLAQIGAAQAAADVARAQRQLLGPGVATMGRQAILWVRVPVFGSDIGTVTRGASAMIRPLADATAGPSAARPVTAPPSANAVAGTTDLFFALDGRDGRWRVGQRVAVALPMRGTTQGLTVPTAAIVRDINGGEWVYRKTEPNVFVRQRIAVASVTGGTALLGKGLEVGAEIVTEGAAELFGTEFGTPH